VPDLTATGLVTTDAAEAGIAITKLIANNFFIILVRKAEALEWTKEMKIR
jgi:hypothetical protein